MRSECIGPLLFLKIPRGGHRLMRCAAPCHRLCYCACRVHTHSLLDALAAEVSGTHYTIALEARTSQPIMSQPVCTGSVMCWGKKCSRGVYSSSECLSAQV